MPSGRFGKHPPKVDYRTLRLKSYLMPELGPPPPSDNVLTRVYAKLQINDPTRLFPMDGNDTLGDCTIAPSRRIAACWGRRTSCRNRPPRTERRAISPLDGSCT